MTARVYFAIPLSLLVLGCGEDSTSRFVPSDQPWPETAGIRSAGPETQDGLLAPSQNSVPAITPPDVSDVLDCASLASPFLAEVELLDGLLVHVGEARVIPLVIPVVLGCEFEVSLLTAEGSATPRGQILTDGGLVYQAPGEAASVFAETVRISVKGHPELVRDLRVFVLPEGVYFIPDLAGIQGAIANVYLLPDTTRVLPDFDAMVPDRRLLAPNIDVPSREWVDGIPGLGELVEWFGIRYSFALQIDEPGEYFFAVESDDGSRLLMGDRVIIDNDGQHASRRVETPEAIFIDKGAIPLRLDYFQGPRYRIQVQLLWRRAHAENWTIVPSSVFRRDAGGTP